METIKSLHLILLENLVRRRLIVTPDWFWKWRPVCCWTAVRAEWCSGVHWVQWDTCPVWLWSSRWWAVIMRGWTLVLVLLLAVVVLEVHGKRGGGGRGGGGRSGGRSGGWGSRSSSRSSSSYSRGKKSSFKSKLKKAAVIGAVAYGSYQVIQGLVMVVLVFFAYWIFCPHFYQYPCAAFSFIFLMIHLVEKLHIFLGWQLRRGFFTVDAFSVFLQGWLQINLLFLDTWLVSC